MYQQLDQAVRDEFERKGVMYVRRYLKQDMLGLGWKTIFSTEDKDVVEQKCQHQKMSAEWRENDVLITRAVRSAVWKHPETLQTCWVNQAQHWHFSCLPVETRNSFIALYDPEDFARNCYFGDGSPIGDNTMAYILAQYEKFQVYQPWQRGDFVMADNLLVAHARRPFQLSLIHI